MTMTAQELIDQAKTTVFFYFESAESYLNEKYSSHEASFDNIIKLADLMARDFELMMNYQQKRRLIDEIAELKQMVGHVATKVWPEEESSYEDEDLI